MAGPINPRLSPSQDEMPSDSRHSQVITFEELQKMCDPTGRPRLARVLRWADRIGLSYAFDGRGGIFSTWLALHAAMGVSNTPEAAAVDPHLFG